MSFLQCDGTPDSSRLGVAKESPEVVTDFFEFRNSGTLRQQECFQRQFDGMGEKVVAGGKLSPLSFGDLPPSNRSEVC